MASPDQKIVLITGANTGIGFATAKLVLEASPNHHVVLGSRDIDRGRDAAKELHTLSNVGDRATLVVPIDVSSPSSISHAVESVREKYGHLDVLVNNAAICHATATPGATTSTETLRSLLEVNLIGSCAVTEAFKDLLVKSQDPRLIFVTTSLASFEMGSDPSLHQSKAKHRPQFVEYRISKAAVNMAMIEYMKALEDDKVKVWGVDPGINRTNLISSITGNDARKMALPGPETGGAVIADVILGKRDSQVGKVVFADGVRPW